MVHAGSHEKGQLTCLGEGGEDTGFWEIMPGMSLKDARVRLEEGSRIVLKSKFCLARETEANAARCRLGCRHFCAGRVLV